MEFVYERHKGSNVMLMHLRDEDVETLEDGQPQNWILVEGAERMYVLAL